MKKTIKELLITLCLAYLFMLMIFSLAYIGIKIDNESKGKIIDSLKTEIYKYKNENNRRDKRIYQNNNR